jgi:hypothetical protein
MIDLALLASAGFGFGSSMFPERCAMPSPFPGMNPYFERSTIWLDFHTEFLTSLRRLLVPQVTPKYIVQLDEHVYIHDAPTEERRWVGRSDLSVAQGDASVAEHRGIGLMEAPAEVFLPEQDLEGIPFLEIRDRENRELITVIELLSPSNKRPGPDREQYLAKRRDYLRSAAHLVEIDLLRGWKPMPALGRPDCDYSIMVSQAEKRRAADFWPVRLREQLPVIPIPLRQADGAAHVDLQEVLNRAYDGPGYEHVIYAGTPEPPLSAEDDAWARHLIAAQWRA